MSETKTKPTMYDCYRLFAETMHEQYGTEEGTSCIMMCCHGNKNTQVFSGREQDMIEMLVSAMQDEEVYELFMKAMLMNKMYTMFNKKDDEEGAEDP